MALCNKNIFTHFGLNQKNFAYGTLGHFENLEA